MRLQSVLSEKEKVKPYRGLLTLICKKKKKKWQRELFDVDLRKGFCHILSAFVVAELVCSPVLPHMVYNHWHQVVISAFVIAVSQNWDGIFFEFKWIICSYLFLIPPGYCVIMNCKGQSRFLFARKINARKGYKKKQDVFQSENGFLATGP